MKNSATQAKFPFEEVDHVFGALFTAFHVEEREDPHSQFLALWVLFLQCAGWTEDEYWAAVDELNDEEALDDEETLETNDKSKQN